MTSGKLKSPVPQVPMRKFSQSLPMSLLRARESVMRHFRISLRAHDLTEQQWRILRAISASGESEVSDLARTAFLLGPSLSRILRDLETRRLIKRHLMRDDKRRNIVSLTAKGVSLITAVAPESEAIYAKITGRFGVDRLMELQNLLAELELCLVDMPVASDAPDTDS